MKKFVTNPSPEFKNVYKKISGKFKHGITTYKMIEEGDRIAIALSGGKDSWTLLHLMLDLQACLPIKFEVIPITVETGFPGFNQNVDKLKKYIDEVLKIEYIIIHDNFPDIIDKHITPGTTSCSFCARMRRGALYTHLQKHNINKLALGHHANDIIESMLMGQMYNGVLWTQRPLLKAKNKNITLIRPMVLVFEEQIIQFKDFFSFPIVTCNCPHEGNPNHKRFQVKQLVKDLTQKNPQIQHNFLKAAQQLFEIIKDDEKEDME